MRATVSAASAPGRVTLLGEHTDYNGGSALAVATEQRTTVAVEQTGGSVVEVASDACGSASTATAAPSGPSFVILAAALARRAGVGGASIRVAGDLPIGAGLSSSASYAVALALALGVPGDDLAVARACQGAERDAGSDVGLLDQLVALHAQSGAVVDLDFSDLAVGTFPLSPRIALTVVDTGERRAVATSQYAARRAECEAAARRIGPLGRATLADLEALDEGTLRQRARHVVTECARVLEGRGTLLGGDLARFGELLDEAHASLRDDFEVSTAAVERARAAVRSMRGVAGARLTGAGFGGCLVVAHDPDVRVAVDGRWSSRVVPGAGARLSSAS